jgi:aromatic ring-cleaving dioxygenase
MSPLIPKYHAHIYYNAFSIELAEPIREWLLKLQEQHKNIMYVGAMHNKPIGPHTQPMFMASFNSELFTLIVSYLMLNHKTLSVLVHPETGDELMDHTEYPLWIGDKIPLDLSKL